MPSYCDRCCSLIHDLNERHEPGEKACPRHWRALLIEVHSEEDALYVRTLLSNLSAVVDDVMLLGPQHGVAVETLTALADRVRDQSQAAVSTSTNPVPRD